MKFNASLHERDGGLNDINEEKYINIYIYIYHGYGMILGRYSVQYPILKDCFKYNHYAPIHHPHFGP